MGFETVVLDKVAKVLDTDNKAAFEYGTLFVDCTAKEAAKIETVLKKMIPFGGIIVTPQGVTGEFSFDFI
jgi:hypothetical protein